MRKLSREEILNGSPIKVMFLLSVPIIISNLMQSLYNLADTFWLGHLPPSESGGAVAGMQVAWPLIWMFIAFTAGFAMAGIALVSQYTGAKEEHNANYTAGQLLSVAVIFGLITLILGVLLAPYVARFATHNKDVLANATAYIRLIFLGMPFMFVAGVFQAVLSAKGDTLTPMYVNLFTVSLNIVLDPFLIFGWWIFPHMGISGAALATVICQGIAAAIAIYIFFSGKHGIKIYLKDLIPNFNWYKKIIKIGLPASIGSSTSALGFFLVTAIIGRVSNAEIALAAYGIGDRIISLEFIVLDALGMAVATIIGQTLGADMIERTKLIAKKGLQTSVVLTVIESLILIGLNVPIFRLFIPNRPDVIKEGIKFASIFVIGIPFYGIIDIISALFRGSGHNNEPMVVDMVRLWGLRIPLALLLGWKFGSTGIWWGMAISNLGGATVALIFYKKGNWTKKVIEKTAAEMPLAIPEE